MTFAACPDSELLAACAEGRLRGDERERVLRHLTTCHDCYTVFTEALHLLDELPALAAETAESRVPVASDAQGALPERLQPVKPPSADPATPRPLDGTLPATAPTTPSPSSLGQPDAPDTAKPDRRGDESRDNVIPFDRRRGRRVATVALPLAAAAALAVVVMQQHPPQGPISSPVTIAQAPSPEPTPAATPTPASAVAMVRVADLPKDVHRAALEQPRADTAFARYGRSQRCLYAGRMSIDIEVSCTDLLLAARLLDQTGTVWKLSHADDRGAMFKRLAGEAREGRCPASVELRPSECPAVLLDAGRAAELVRLAALTRDKALLRHPEVVSGLVAVHERRVAEHQQEFDALARLAALPPADDDLAGWDRLRRKAEDLTLRWQP